MPLSIRRPFLALLLLPLLLATCGEEEGGPTPARLAIVLAPPASAMNGAPFTIKVQVVTADGTPVAVEGVEVTASAAGGLVLAGDDEVPTDGDGLATFTGLSLTGAVGPAQLSFAAPRLQGVATAPFALTAGQPVLLTVDYGDGQSAPVLSYAPVGAAVIATDAHGNPVPGVVILIKVEGGNGTIGGLSQATTTTTPDGKAFALWWRMGGAIGSSTLSFTAAMWPAVPSVQVTAQVLRGPPYQVDLVADWPYTFSIDTLLTTPITATVKDEAGNPIPGRVVRFMSYPNGVEGTQIAGADTLTDSLGRATVAGMRAPVQSGDWGIQVTIPGVYVGGSMGFVLQPGPPVRIQVNGPDRFFTPVGRVLTLRARLLDAHDNPVKNKEMQWVRISGPGHLGPIYPATDEYGLSHAEIHADSSVGRTVVRAFATLLPDSVAEFTIDAVAPVALQVVAGDSQRVTAGDTIPVALSLRVVDADGNGVAGVPVKFDDRPSGDSVLTDSTGLVVAPAITARPQLGSYVLRARSPWVADSAAEWTVLPHAGAPTELVRLLQDVNAAPWGEVGKVIPVPPGVKLRDRLGLPVMEGVVHFATQDGNLSVDSAVVDSLTGIAYPQGWTLDTLSGVQHITATMGALTPLQLVANAYPGEVASLVPLAGHGIEGFVGEQVAYGLRVEARDRYGNPARNRSYTTSGAGGGAAGTGGFGGFDDAGHAYVDGWTLGSIGSGNIVRIIAGTDTLDQPALGVAASPFNIQVRGVPVSYAAVFRQAGYQWRRRIVGDIPDLTVNIGAFQCSGHQQAVNGTVDDLIIDVAIGDIDGPGGILGSAGPCVIRTASKLPLLGVMRFDVADADALVADGTFGDVVLHEMGHVLGIGSLWAMKNLLINAGTIDPQYNGANGKIGWAEIGGLALDVATVPVENTGGAGTRDAHWREAVMPSELMTGYLSALVNPMSVVTIHSLSDLGYDVDASTADPYTVMTAPMPAPGRAPLRIRDKVGAPRFTVDENGTVRPIQ